MKKKFDLNLINRESEHVLKYLFDFKDTVTVDLYFERVRIYLSNVLYNEKNLSEKHIAPSLENKEVCKQIFSTVLIMMYLPLSLDYLPKTKSYKINEEIDCDDTNPKSVLYTVNINVKDFMKRIPEEYFISPASTKYHGAFSGGLMCHSLGVLKSVLDTCDVYLTDKYILTDTRTEIRNNICSNLPAILLHDFCKVGKYKFIEDKKKYEYNYDTDPSFQHGAESYRRIIHEGFHLSKEWELAVVYHMGVFDVSKQEMMDFSSITEKVPEVLLLHHADMISSKILHM